MVEQTGKQMIALSWIGEPRNEHGLAERTKAWANQPKPLTGRRARLSESEERSHGNQRQPARALEGVE
jgi:hypothetical protein